MLFKIIKILQQNKDIPLHCIEEGLSNFFDYIDKSNNWDLFDIFMQKFKKEKYFEHYLVKYTSSNFKLRMLFNKRIYPDIHYIYALIEEEKFEDLLLLYRYTSYNLGDYVFKLYELYGNRIIKYVIEDFPERSPFWKIKKLRKPIRKILNNIERRQIYKFNLAEIDINDDIKGYINNFKVFAKDIIEEKYNYLIGNFDFYTFSVLNFNLLNTEAKKIATLMCLKNMLRIKFSFKIY